MRDIERIAKVCHEVNRVFCESIGDHTQYKWEDSEDWQKKSAIDGVKFFINNPDATSEDVHEDWMKNKFKDGWKFGSVKDAKKKTHPCLVAYENLSKEPKN